ncbi:MAG: sulfatase-like hydrolase/transferase, partial [Planctomycetes bacterium]|nr:sulfatase-like hydrolase/transferase [Planctomycetota bacterium]
VSSDHGEAFGELGVYADHQAADEATCHVPAVLRWPGVEPQVHTGLHYQMDLAATTLDLAGIDVPKTWDGIPIRLGEAGRDDLVLSQGAWSCQRGVRFGDHLYLRTSRILSLACGPAAELFDVATDPHIRTRVSATCVDIDNQALDHVAKRAAHEGLAPCFTRHRGNLVHLALGRQHLELPPQDLVYSIGLIDYFGDSFVVRLLDWIHEQLATGGRVILGNFHPNNPSRELMEHVLDWHLVHRDEAAMHRLFRASRFGTGCSKIRFEGEGINLFAECRKA